MNWYHLTLSITNGKVYLFFKNAEPAKSSHITVPRATTLGHHARKTCHSKLDGRQGLTYDILFTFLSQLQHVISVMDLQAQSVRESVSECLLYLFPGFIRRLRRKSKQWQHKAPTSSIFFFAFNVGIH